MSSTNESNDKDVYSSSSVNDNNNDDDKPNSSSVDLSVDEDVFMKEFKYFKHHLNKDLLNCDNNSTRLTHLRDSVLFLDNLNKNFNQENLKKMINVNLNLNDEYKSFIRAYGLKQPNEWNCYELLTNPGLFVIQNPFLPGYQRYLVKKCLVDYHNLPNKTNLDLHVKREGNLWTECNNKKNFTEFNKLRWTTIGYHYDWTKKIYDENDFSEFPIDVANLSKLFAFVLNFERFRPEAGIINYYHLNSTLSAHQDHSEKNMTAPLISISLGCSGLFLLGGQSKSIKPQALYLRSGDIVVMSGQSRLAYHGVPKILKDDHLEKYFSYETENSNGIDTTCYINDEEWTTYFEYLKLNRINLNVRQVFD